MEPRSGRSRPTRVLRNTDLPVPDGPSRTEISPAGSTRLRSAQTGCPPKDFVSPSTTTSTPTSALLCPASSRPGRRALHGPAKATYRRRELVGTGKYGYGAVATAGGDR